MNIVVAMIVQDSEDFIEMALRSVLTFADKIIIVDGGSKDKTLDVIESLSDERVHIIHSAYDKKDPGMDGKQRNIYINHLIEHNLGDWCLVIDADEVVSDNGWELKKECEAADKQGIVAFSPHMEHFVYNLRLVDASVEKHFVPMRLFKVQKGIKYPEVEHNILQVPDIKPDVNIMNLTSITIFHLGYIRGLFSVMNRYYKNLKKSNIHSQEFLINWKNAHVLGSFPVKKYEGEYPKAMRRYFALP